MGEHELELHGEFALPEIVGFKAQVGARYRGSWQRRGKELVDVIQTQAGISQEDLGERLAEDERLRDAFLRGGKRAIETGNAEYRAALGRLIAAALDDARIDEAEYLLAQVIKLEPLHVRALVAMFTYWAPKSGEVPQERPGTRVLAAAEVDAFHLQGHTESGEEFRATLVPASSPEEATHFFVTGASAGSLAKSLEIGDSLAASILDELSSAGLLVEVSNDDSPRSLTGRPVRARSWRPSAWGKQAVRTIFPALRPL